MITTKGRLLTNVQVRFANHEIHISFVNLLEGEDVAILLDTYTNKARIYAPFDECQKLALEHQYELVTPRQPEETFVNHIVRLLHLRHPKQEKPGSPSMVNEDPGLRDTRNAAEVSLLSTEQLVPE